MRELVLDTFCEVYPLLQSSASDEFWEFDQHTVRTGATYVFGRQQFQKNVDHIRELVEHNVIHAVLSNPHEGSSTLRDHVIMYGVRDMVMNKQILIIGGGDMSPEWPCLRYDSFLPKLLDYQENETAVQQYQQQARSDRAYAFLFLNGRGRWHRRWLIQKWQNNELLDRALWTNLDLACGPIKLLPPQYEVDRYSDRIAAVDRDQRYAKHDLFAQEWGEIYLNVAAYLDTYFSVVTETVFDWPYSFRTEKIWKPIVIGHPWIAVSNCGFYRDLRNMGFRTFDGVIDESFDSIENDRQRLRRISEVVEDLVQQDLAAFLDSTREVCIYNQYHYQQCREQVRAELPQRFFDFLDQHHG